MNIRDILFEHVVGPAKENLKTAFLDGMDKSSRVLVVTRRLAEELNIFDSVTYTNILSQYAEKHFEETKGMNVEELMVYMKEGENEILYSNK